MRKPREYILPHSSRPEDLIPGRPLHYATTAYVAGDVAGLLIESQDGRPTKIYGNPNHPASGGGTDARTQAEIMRMWDADRSRTPKKAGADATWADFQAAWDATASAVAGGSGLALLVENNPSPTFVRLLGRLRSTHPSAKVFVHDSGDDANARAGAAMIGLGAEGDDPGLRQVVDLSGAKVVLALDSDFLTGGTGSIRLSRGWSNAKRTAGEDAANLPRLYVVEPGFSTTGASADNRLRMKAAGIGGFLSALVAKLGVGSVIGGAVVASAAGSAKVDGMAAKWVDAVAEDLRSAGGKAVVIVGERQPAAVHALAFFANMALGAVGETVAWYPRTSARFDGGINELTAAIQGGSVKTLIMLGGNPAYTAASDLDFVGALAKVGTSIHLSDRVDETSAEASWHVPEAHWLEAWGDTRSEDGTAGIQQPLVAPLFDGLSAIELLGRLVGAPKTDGYSLVRATWAEGAAAGFERDWNRWLHDGVIADSAFEPVDPNRPPAPAADPPAAGDPLAAGDGSAEVDTTEDAPAETVRAFTPAWSGLASAVPTAAAGDGHEVNFVFSSTLYDGRYANVGWMLELPEPISKLMWDNAAEMSPATARKLGVANNDMVSVTSGGRSLDLPVWTVPGVADGVILVRLGWGRTAAGVYGDGQGFDAGKLRAGDALWFADADVKKTSGEYDLVTAQPYGRLEATAHIPILDIDIEYPSRPIAVAITASEYETSLADLHAEKDGHGKGHGGGHGGGHKPEKVVGKGRLNVLPHPLMEPVSIYKQSNVTTGQQWGMSIDLNSCTGCNACTIACNAENNISIVGKARVAKGREQHWIRLDRYFTGDVENPEAIFQPLPCQQCETAPCEQVCPVAATTHSPEGLNDMVYNRCIGTRYCANNCPFKVRRFNYFNYSKENEEANPLIQMQRNPNVTVRFRGVMEKCTYCVQRINIAKIDAHVRGDSSVSDGTIKTACQQVCPTDAIVFGDIANTDSAISKRRADARDYSLLEDLNTHARTTYMARVRNPNPELA
jgi:molybdopterin-containing oxidoreductase family iron-sulfur binding subunit